MAGKYAVEEPEQAFFQKRPPSLIMSVTTSSVPRARGFKFWVSLYVYWAYFYVLISYDFYVYLWWGLTEGQQTEYNKKY